MRMSVISIVIFMHGKVSSSDVTCKLSTSTITPVKYCPTTEQDLQNAVLAKDCQSLAEVQKCTEKYKFRYHCVLSTTKADLYEVCAPTIISHGYCVGYDVRGQNLQMLFNDPCSNSTEEKCPKSFSSEELLKYSFCQKRIVANNTDKRTPVFSSDDHVRRNSSKGMVDTTTLVLFLVIGFVFIFPFGICFIKMVGKEKLRHFWNSCTQCCRGNARQNSDEENATDPLQNSEDNYQNNKDHTGERLDDKSKISSSCSGDEQPSLKYDVTGFDNESFEKVIKDFRLGSMENFFKEHDINCVQAFVMLNAETLETLGMSIGNRFKCLQVIKCLTQRSRSNSLLQARQPNDKNRSKAKKSRYSDPF